MTLPTPVVAVTGLAVEARIASGSGITTVAGGGDPVRLALLLEAALATGARAVISFGIAGGLRPGLTPGTVLVGRSVDDGRARIPTDRAWAARLEAALPGALLADLAGVDRAICGIGQKAELHAATGAAAVDMESHIAARLAALHHLPVAALRIVADPFDRAVPGAAAVGMRPDGSTDVGAVLRALGRKPSDLPGLIRTALDARAAFGSLARSRRQLSALLGFDTLPIDRLREGRTGLDPAPELELGFAAQMDPLMKEESLPTRRIAYALAGLAFLSVDGLEASVRVLASPALALPSVGLTVSHLGALLSHALQLSLVAAGPVLVAGVTANLSMGLASRAAPSLNVFSVVIPSVLLLGSMALLAAAPMFIHLVFHIARAAAEAPQALFLR